MVHRTNIEEQDLGRDGESEHSFKEGTFSETVHLSCGYGILGRRPGSVLQQYITEAEKNRRQNQRINDRNQSLRKKDKRTK